MPSTTSTGHPPMHAPEVTEIPRDDTAAERALKELTIREQGMQADRGQLLNTTSDDMGGLIKELEEATDMTSFPKFSTADKTSEGVPPSQLQ